MLVFLFFDILGLFPILPMVSETLSMWGNGAVTLPKKWRDQFQTKHFMAKETAQGLLIRPILDAEYYELADGTVGVRFPMGIEAGELARRIEKIDRKIRKEERLRSRKKKK